ncbi:hypothetical protein GCM10008018_72380 [Paenibacillus marchantiophytorum]|uniref:Uncharacterized protein n=1 Tax=Paenibacillus marchantiophytorum TaxID=1619310 RepID=A0ABQ1FL46_9BACL|nr:hypothetical protein GCM10008018_72380 [Paenibacillus marchantiophytorum]
MQGIKVSIDRIVVDFTNVYWDFFNPLRQWLCEYYNAIIILGIKGLNIMFKSVKGKTRFISPI